eukprot:Amastigsp_a512472_6.p4 type:complete len:109 gc:universal Amastigsp_a512472_6:391-65(-)
MAQMDSTEPSSKSILPSAVLRATTRRRLWIAASFCSCVPCEKLRRMTFMPDSRSPVMPSSLHVLGPTVHMILVARSRRRLRSTSSWMMCPSDESARAAAGVAMASAAV